MNPYDSYWRLEAAYYEGAYDKARTRVNAACRAVGAAGYLLSPACTYANAERLVQLAEIIADLRAALDLDPPTDQTPDQQAGGQVGQAGSQVGTDTTTDTDGTTGTRAAGGEGL